MASLDANDNLIPIYLSSYARLFDTIVPGYKMPHPRNGMERLYHGTYDYLIYCKVAHKLNTHPVNRPEMETLWALFLREMFRLWEIKERYRCENNLPVAEGGFLLWTAAYDTYTKCLKYLDTYAADNYWRRKVEEEGYEDMDIEWIPLCSEEERPPAPDYWIGEQGMCIDVCGDVEVEWMKAFWEMEKKEANRKVQMAKEEAHENFYEIYLGKTAEEKKMIGVMRRLGRVKIESDCDATEEPARKMRKAAKAGDIKVMVEELVNEEM